MISELIAYAIGRSSARREQQLPYQLTRKQYRKIRQPVYVMIAWKISIIVTAVVIVGTMIALCV